MTTNRSTATILRGVIVGQHTVSDVEIRAGKIVAIQKADKGKADIGGASALIAPTLFDIQVNGYGGVNLQGREVAPDDVVKLDRLLAATGVSHWIPTLITASLDDMEHGCRVIAEALQDKSLAKRIPGIHLEGPNISPVDGPRGAHPKQHVRKPNLKEFDRLMKAADGKVVYTTLAPDVDGAIPFIKGVVKRGVVVSLGHHNATPDQIARAVDAGATLCTHLGNGMSPMIPRHNNPLWPQLADDRLTCSLIADLHHLPAHVMKTFARAKGAGRIVLTSDVVHIAGQKPGRYELGGHPVELKPTGKICLSGTELLAGSSLNLLQGVLNTAEVTDLTLEQAFACATTVPWKVLRIPGAPPAIKVGAKASLIVFENRGGTAKVIQTFSGGKIL